MTVPFEPTAFRRHFPVLRNLLFFNHAAVAPLPQPAVDAMRGFLDDSSQWASIHEGPDWTRRHREVRALFARLVGGEPHEVAYVKNTTEGLGFVAAGLDWRAGDNVVWLEGEYPSNVYPWWHLRRHGVEARMVPQRPGARFEVDDIVAAIDRRTRLVAVSSVEFSTGFRNDVDAIGAACRERGVLLCVDAIQSLGALRMDVRRTPVDFLSADGHKWLLSPEGIGAFWASDRVIDQLTPAYVGWMSVRNAGNFDVLDATLKPHAGKLEGGTLNTIGIYGFGAALELLLDAGMERVEARILANTRHLIEGLRARGFTVTGSDREGEISGIVAFEGRADPKEIVEKLAARSIVAALRGGRVRLSPHFYNSAEDFARLFEALDEIAG